jgi:predicted NUDIX family phosphoesterase
MDEEILVVRRELLNRLGYFQGFCREVDRYFPALLAPGNCFFMPRQQVETDPSFKQLIPYVLLYYRDPCGTEFLFQYVRGSGQGERRLHAKRSVGVGGHICRDDQTQVNPVLIYREGLRRELEEEVILKTTWAEECVGLINDDLTEVGQVHLGIVHLFTVEKPEVFPAEPDLWEGGFWPISELLAQFDSFETWSQISLQALFAEMAWLRRPTARL